MLEEHRAKIMNVISEIMQQQMKYSSANLEIGLTIS